jgi:hypothetical protein
VFDISLLHALNYYHTHRYCNKKTTIDRITDTQSLYFVNKSFYDGIATLVDNRPKNKIAFHIFNVLQHIPVTWPVQIFYGEANYLYLSENIHLKPYINSGRIILTKLYDEKLFRNPNQLYTTIEFYEQIRGEKILNFQLDSVFCTNSPHKLSDFLQYDYIGAPWSWENKHGSVGNSGLSLRSRNKTIELLRQHPYNYQKNEDQWFGLHFHLVNASLPTPQVAATFSVESLYYDKPLGIHMPGIYIKETEYQALCKQCPETRMVWPYCQEPHPISRE